MNRMIWPVLCGGAIAVIIASHGIWSNLSSAAQDNIPQAPQERIQASIPKNNIAQDNMPQDNIAQAPSPPNADSAPVTTAMTAARLGAILADTVENLEGPTEPTGPQNQWQFEYRGVSMVAVTNDDHDRMRLLAPITRATAVTMEQQQKMLVANFHSALDARYAIGSLGNQPAVVSVFVHPLTSLQENHLRSALDQVSQSAKTFGSTYSSGELLLRPDGSAPQPPQESDDRDDLNALTPWAL